MTLNEYLFQRFIRSNHPKYHKYAEDWITHLTCEQIMYFRKEMLNAKF